MRNFKHFVFEDHSPVKSISEDEFFHSVTINCSDMLDAYSQAGDPNSFLFRGVSDAHSIRTTNKKFISAGIRADRRPVEMQFPQHARLHDSFLRLGLHATRKNSIFCSTSQLTASDWGMPFIVFVENGWHATVFDNIPREDYVFDHIHDIPRDTSDEALDDIIRSLKPRNISSAGELADVIDEQYRDILVTGKKYYGLWANVANDAKTHMLNRLFRPHLLNKIS